jgi:hypothetical protein
MAREFAYYEVIFMKKNIRKITSAFACVLLSVSVCFTSAGGCYYQAAEVGGIAIWSLIETLFFSLGVTFEISDSVDKSVIDDILIEDIQRQAEEVADGTRKGPLLELADYMGNIINYWDDVTGLTIPQTIWETLKYYCGERVAPRPGYRPVDSDVNLYGCTQEQYTNFLSSYFGISTSDFNRFCGGTYSLFYQGDYSFIIAFDGISYVFYPLSVSQSYYYRELGDGGSSYILNYVSSNAKNYVKSSHRYSVSSDSYYDSYTVGRCYFDSDTLFVVKGQIYELDVVCSKPVNTTTGLDYGTSFCISDFAIPKTEISAGVYTSAVSDVVDIPADAYDVLTPGRTWDEEKGAVIGDVVIPFPGNDLLNAYYNGEITWQQLMEALGVTVVDTEKGETITGEDIREIIFEETTDILEAIKSLPQVLLDGIASLFIPSEEFLDEAFLKINEKLNALGIAPYDMGAIFDNGGENPFEDIKITIYGQTVTIVSFAYLPMFLDKFRPVIRGLFVLFMIYFAVNQLLQLFGLAGIIQTGKKGDE